MAILLNNLSPELEAALHRRAEREGKPVETAVADVLRDVMRYEALLGEKKRDLSDLCGKWVHDPEFDRAIAEMRQIDPEKWR